MKDWSPQHNLIHLRQRKNERAVDNAQQAVELVIEYCKFRCKNRQVPNGPWRCKVHFKGEFIGHVVGTGVKVSSFLDATQTAVGKDLR
jgi:hypothetical protein